MCGPARTQPQAGSAWDLYRITCMPVQGTRPAAPVPGGTLQRVSTEPAAGRTKRDLEDDLTRSLSTLGGFSKNSISPSVHDLDESPSKVIRHSIRRARRPFGGAGLSSGYCPLPQWGQTAGGACRLDFHCQLVTVCNCYHRGF
jgi:hypothetical protein